MKASGNTCAEEMINVQQRKTLPESDGGVHQPHHEMLTPFGGVQRKSRKNGTRETGLVWSVWWRRSGIDGLRSES
jgi:hypothetical protein